VKTLSQVLGTRKGTVVTVGPREYVHHALKLMAEHEVGALLVLQKGSLVGVVGEQDYAHNIERCGKSAAEARVQEIMTAAVVCASQQTTVKDAIRIMTEHQVRHLPVLDEFKDVVGVVSMRTLVQETIAAQSFAG
jgi:CBS domain-containing protein